MQESGASNPPSVDRLALAAFRDTIVRYIPAQVIACIEELDDEQLWWRPNPQTNSVGNLVLHVAGAVPYHLSLGVQHLDPVRDRLAEFTERGPIPKPRLLEILDKSISDAASALDSFDTSRFMDKTDEPEVYKSIYSQVFATALHMATHAGQIVYVTKMLKEGSINELWRQTRNA